jgi:hypothetical protein
MELSCAGNDSAQCRVVEKIAPDLKVRYKASKMPFVQMENINQFLQALIQMGVPDFERFMTVDLYEEKNMLAVLECIYSFSRHAAKKGYISTPLGPKLSS